MTHDDSLNAENSLHEVESAGDANRRENSHRDVESAGNANQRQDEVLIAVMGSTGTGKSSFIRLMSGDTSVDVGDSLESETSNIQVIRFFDQASGRNVVLVDTPGFDDSRAGVSDTDILKEITRYLLEQYDEKRKLNGLVYLQRISDPRFGGQSGRNLRMFKGLCGSENYKNVVVLTTFWDRIVNEAEGVKREDQLKAKFFKELVTGSAQFMRHQRGNMETGRKVLDHLFTLLPTNVRIQEEIRVEGKPLVETAAGSVHNEEMDRMISKHKKEMAALQEEMKTIHANNTAEREAMKEELDRVRKHLERQEEERLELKKGLDEAKESQVQLKQTVAEQEEMRRQDEEKHREELGEVQYQFNEEKISRLLFEHEMREQREREWKERVREMKERDKRLREEREREAREGAKQEEQMAEREKRLREEKEAWEKQLREAKDAWEEQLCKEKEERAEQLRKDKELWDERLGKEKEASIQEQVKPSIQVQARS